MTEENAVFARKGDQPGEELSRGRCPGGHVRIVHPHHLHAGEVKPLQFLPIRLPCMLFIQDIGHNRGAGEMGDGRIGRVTGIGNKHGVAGVQKRHCHIDHTLF